MIISIAQIKPVSGDIPANIGKHKELIELAASRQPSVVFFPELSITGYEPLMANDLAMYIEDECLAGFQKMSDDLTITIGIGLPTRSATGIRISLAIFQPLQTRKLYSKQLLHEDELPFFEPGHEQLLISCGQVKMAPAICYESLQPAHASNAHSLGAQLYLASVAKPQKGVEKAFNHYPQIAVQYGFPVLMANCVGFCDNFMSVGQSSVWNREGQLVGQLNATEQGLLLFNTDTELVSKIIVNE